MIYLQLGAGLAILAVGGDLLVRGAVDCARWLKVSPLLIGLTLIGFGTSLPELVTSLEAAFARSPGIAVGNVVGSNIANILLILGLAAIVRPINTPEGSFRRDGGMVVLSALVCAAIVFIGYLSPGVGALLLALLAVYVIYSYQHDRVTPPLRTRDRELFNPRLAAFFAISGLAAVIFGARLLVFGAIDLARHAGVSETTVGLTIVAVGTSLPELAASVAAALRRDSDVTIGTVMGSNIFNILGILGITAVVRPIPVPAEIAAFDIWVMIGATALLIVFAVTNWRISRKEGVVFVALYCLYVGYLVHAA